MVRRILADAVGLRRIDLDDIAVRPHPAEAHEVLHVLRRIQVLAGRERGVVMRGDLGQEREVERIARLLEPAQPERRQRLGVGERLGAVELAVGVDRELRLVAEHLQHRLDAAAILGERQAADLHLDHGVAGIEMPAHLVLQIRQWSGPANTSRRRRSRTPCCGTLPPL